MGWNPRRMRVRLSLLLPSAQLLLAVAMWEWARRAPWPKGSDTLYFPTVDLVSKGINGPAVLLTRILELPFDRENYWPGSILGLPPDRILFYLGVVVLWYLVGRALDRYIHSKAPGRTRMTVGRAVANLLCVVLGICIFVGALTFLHIPYQQNNPTGYLALGILLLAWSAVLVGVPALRLAKRILGRATISSPG